MVKVETEYLIGSYPSVAVYKSIKHDLNKKYNRTKVEIEDLRNSLTTLEDRNMWIQWIERFGNEMRDKKQISESSKYEILRGVLRDIIVSFDHEKQVHMFTINFNIPCFFNYTIFNIKNIMMIITTLHICCSKLHCIFVYI